MNQEKAIAFVVRRKRAFRSRDKIANELAAMGAIDYYQARQFVRYVEQNHGRRVALAQMPLVLALGIPALLVGLIMLAGPLASIYLGNYHPLMIRQLVLGIGLFFGGFWGILALLRPFFSR